MSENINMSKREHAHHFDSMEHEFESSKQGLWLFLVQEVLFFAGIFLAYTIVRTLHPDMFHEASKTLDPKMGGLNTIVLILSSLTMALAVSSAQRGLKGRTVRFLIATWLLAGVFLVVKYFEYAHKIHEGMLPGGLYHFEGLTHPKAHMFFSVYFVATGVHGIHVIGGMVAIAWLIRRAARGEFGPNYFTPVEMVGLYWHFVDLVWIYLFPLLYLVG